MTSLQRHQTTSIEVRFRGHKNVQAQQGSVVGRTRDNAWGQRSRVGAGGGDAVALMVELSPGYPTLPENAPLSSYQYGNEVREWKYQEALEALRHVVAEAEDELSEVALHSLRIGVVTTLAAGGEVPQRVIQREGRWKSSESSKFFFLFSSSLLLVSLTRRRFYPQRASGQAVVTGICPSPPRYVPLFFVALRVKHSHCSSILIECVANSRSRAFC